MKDVLARCILRAFSGPVRSKATPVDRGVHTRLVTVAAMSEFGFDDCPAEDLVCEAHTVDQYGLREGDVLVSVRGFAGKIAVAGPALAGAVATANILVLRLNSSRLLPEVLWAYLASPKGRSALTGILQSSSGQMAMSLQGLLDLEIPIPSMAKQTEIAAVVRAGVAAHRSAVETAKATMQVLRQALAETLDREC